MGRNKRSVWTIPAKGFPGAHFATFPTKLVIPCVKAGCPKNGIVFDPFSGAGTTGVVANALGRRYVGTDLSLDYLTMSRERIARPHISKPKPAKKTPGQRGLFDLFGETVA